jgi:hypothetical protein
MVCSESPKSFQGKEILAERSQPFGYGAAGGKKLPENARF